jgi:hypothetical protein
MKGYHLLIGPLFLWQAIQVAKVEYIKLLIQNESYDSILIYKNNAVSWRDKGTKPFTAYSVETIRGRQGPNVEENRLKTSTILRILDPDVLSSKTFGRLKYKDSVDMFWYA